MDVSIPPVSKRLRAITGNSGRSTLPGLRYSDVKERRGNTDLKLITRSKGGIDDATQAVSRASSSIIMVRY